MSGLSLYNIEAALLDLLTAREELLAKRGDPKQMPDWEDTEAELDEVEKALAEYVRAEVKKCDGIHHYLTAAKQTAEAARLEAQRMTERARRLEESTKLLKALCVEVMAMAGTKRIDGTAGRYLRRKVNGGLAPLVVQDDVLPSEFRDITVRMCQSDWDVLMKSDYSTIGHKVEDCQPANDRIRAALAAGEEVPGARLGERGEHLEIK